MKFALWLMKTALIAAIASSVSVFVSWAIVNAYIREALSMYGAGSLGPIGIADALGLWEQSGAAPDAKPGDADSHANTDANAGTIAKQSDPAENEEPSRADGKTPGGEAPAAPKDALAVMGQAAQSAEQLYVSEEQLQAWKESIAPEAKVEIFSLILSKVPAEEIKTISSLFEGGLHAEEIDSVRAILERYLTEEEMERLLDLLQ